MQQIKRGDLKWPSDLLLLQKMGKKQQATTVDHQQYDFQRNYFDGRLFKVFQM